VLSIAGLGGILGVLFSVPLRRSLIIEQDLAFPEGTAAAEVLRAGDNPARGLKVLATAGLLGGLGKFAAASGLNLIPDTAGRVASRVSLAAAFGLSRRSSASRRYAACAAGDATVGSDARDQTATCCPHVFAAWPPDLERSRLLNPHARKAPPMRFRRRPAEPSGQLRNAAY
jgi:hypothetical protein